MFVLYFDISNTVNRFNKLDQLAIPEAQKKTFYKFGYIHRNVDMPKYMKKVFLTPVPFTLRSVYYKVYDENTMAFYLRKDVPKGNAPAKYIYPLAKEAVSRTAYETKFSYWLRNYSGFDKLRNRYAIPYENANVKKINGRMAGSEYTRVKEGLKQSMAGNTTKKGNAYRYYAQPSKGKARGKGKQGIYRVKGKGNPELLFTLAKIQPSQKVGKFDFKLATKQSVDKHLQKIFNIQMKKVLAKYK